MDEDHHPGVGSPTGYARQGWSTAGESAAGMVLWRADTLTERWQREEPRRGATHAARLSANPDLFQCLDVHVRDLLYRIQSIRQRVR
jgi:hypothetical protein